MVHGLRRRGQHSPTLALALRRTVRATVVPRLQAVAVVLATKRIVHRGRRTNPPGPTAMRTVVTVVLLTTTTTTLTMTMTTALGKRPAAVRLLHES